jgi:hypothetical protein
MNHKKHIAILLLAGIAIFGLIFLWRGTGTCYHGHGLSWWVDQYGNFENPPERRAEAKAALSAIGINAVPYLMSLMGGVDAKPPDTNDLNFRMWHRAWFAAASFSALGTNATPYIPEIKVLAANPTNGNVCVVAECALANMGPDGVAAAVDVIATPGLPQRGVLVQSSAVGQHLQPPDAMTAVGQADPNFRTNSIRAAPFLLKCLEDQDSRVQHWAVRLLSSSDPTSMVSALTNFLAGSPPLAIRGQAVAALAKHGQDARLAVPFFLFRCSDSDPEIRTEATNALMQIAPEVLSIDHLRSNQPP